MSEQGLVLYVAKDKYDTNRYDLGSVLCMELVEQLPADSVRVVEHVHGTQHAAWLKGTPTLVDGNSNIYTGHQAYTYLKSAALSHAVEITPKNKPSVVERRDPQPTEGGAEGGADDASWTIPAVENEPEDERFDAKISSDDFAIHTQRMAENFIPPRAGSDPPPPPSLTE